MYIAAVCITIIINVRSSIMLDIPLVMIARSALLGTPVRDFQIVDVLVSMQLDNANYQRIREIYIPQIYISWDSGTRDREWF